VTNNVTELDPSFRDLNFDALSYLIEEAHNNGIEVHHGFGHQSKNHLIMAIHY